MDIFNANWIQILKIERSFPTYQSTNIFSITYLADEIVNAYRNEGKFIRCVLVKVFWMAQY